MSVRKDPSGRHWVQAEVEVPGTPEEVWEAIATGPGVSSWFVPTEMREDGAIVCKFGPGMEAVARQTAWEPPHRFVGEAEMGPGGPKMATEWIVEARSGGTCVVRVVHSLFAETDDWDNQLEATEGGWPGYFRVLKAYLTHFRGEPCTLFRVIGIGAGSVPEVWDRLVGPLGLAGLAPGARWSSAPGMPETSGVVDDVAGSPDSPHRGLWVRLEEPNPGTLMLSAFAMGPRVILQLGFYLYGEGAAEAAAHLEPAWQAWVGSQFPMPGAGG